MPVHRPLGPCLKDQTTLTKGVWSIHHTGITMGPKGSRYKVTKDLGPNSHKKSWSLSPTSSIIRYLDPLGDMVYCHSFTFHLVEVKECLQSTYFRVLVVYKLRELGPSSGSCFGSCPVSVALWNFLDKSQTMMESSELPLTCSVSKRK